MEQQQEEEQEQQQKQQRLDRENRQSMISELFRFLMICIFIIDS